MKKMITMMMVAVLALSMLAGCGSTKTTGSVATDGSTSMEKVIGALGEAFQNDTGISFTYNPTGSGSGIKAVQEGRCDIGLSSRDLKDEEKAAGLTGTVLAYDGIAVGEQCFKKSAVCIKAGGVKDGILGFEELGNLLFQLLVDVLGAADETYR